MVLTLFESIINTKITKELLFQKVEKDFILLPEGDGSVFSLKAAIRYSCSIVLINLSAKYPKKIYPHFDFFVRLLKSKYRIVQEKS